MKLIRHGIVAKVVLKGETIRVRTASYEERRRLVRAKVREEANEYLKDDSVEELVDLIEACVAAAEIRHGTGRKDLFALVEDKLANWGSFRQGVVLLEEGEE